MLAEKEKGAPINVIDVRECLKRVGMMSEIKNITLFVFLGDLARNDELYFDKDADYYSFQERDCFSLFSDRWAAKFPEYVLDDKLKAIPGPECKTLNFDYLMDLWLSKDMTRLTEMTALGEGTPKFLDGKVSMDGHRVAFPSFPRTGNSFLRKYLQQVTGISTGSDM